MQLLRWMFVVALGLAVALAACGESVTGPFKLPPRDASWGASLDPPELERVLAEERWVLPWSTTSAMSAVLST